MKENHNIGDFVGHVLSKRQAIDGTPVYYFILTENVGAGRTLRWDTGEQKLTIADIANNA